MQISLISFLILAQEADPNKGIFSSLMLIPIMLVVMYFLVIRPQKKEENARREMITNLQKGDSVITQSGIHAKVVEFRDNNETVVLNIAQNTNVVFNTSAILAKKTTTK